MDGGRAADTIAGLNLLYPDEKLVARAVGDGCPNWPRRVSGGEEAAAPATQLVGFPGGEIHYALGHQIPFSASSILWFPRNPWSAAPQVHPRSSARNKLALARISYGRA